MTRGPEVEPEILTRDILLSGGSAPIRTSTVEDYSSRYERVKALPPGQTCNNKHEACYVHVYGLIKSRRSMLGLHLSFSE
jgi:hypothetical protein